jgi:hypothetical protein
MRSLNTLVTVGKVSIIKALKSFMHSTTHRESHSSIAVGHRLPDPDFHKIPYISRLLLYLPHVLMLTNRQHTKLHPRMQHHRNEGLGPKLAAPCDAKVLVLVLEKIRAVC